MRKWKRNGGHCPRCVSTPEGSAPLAAPWGKQSRRDLFKDSWPSGFFYWGFPRILYHHSMHGKDLLLLGEGQGRERGGGGLAPFWRNSLEGFFGCLMEKTARFGLLLFLSWLCWVFEIRQWKMRTPWARGARPLTLSRARGARRSG